MRALVCLPLVAIFASACGQKIVVVECDGSHLDDGAVVGADTDGGVGQGGLDGTTGGGGQDAIVNPPRDSGTPPGQDGGTMTNPDGSTTTPDGGIAPPDSGPVACSAAPYCVHDLNPAMPKINVRQAVTFTPTIDNAGGAQLSFSVDKNEITTSRRPGLPAVGATDPIALSLAVDASGNVTFTVNDVPTWFATTTFTVSLHAHSAGGPDVVAQGSVAVRGNVLFSGSPDVLAVASDGRPATSVNFTQGRLLSGSSFVSSPRQMLLARDGTLLVLDMGATPPRIRRFQITGENVQLSDFDYQDTMNPPHQYIPSDQNSRGLAQLMDGHIVLSIYESGRTGGDSYLLVYRENGTFDHMLTAIDPTITWIGATNATDGTNNIWVMESTSNGRIVALDWMTGMELGALSTSIANAHSIMSIPGGGAYVGITGAILKIGPAGAKTMVSMLMGDSSDYWGYFAPFGDGRVVAARDAYSDSINIEVIADTTGQGWLRPPNIGGANIQPTGLAYLE